MLISTEHTASTENGQVAGLWDDAKEKFKNCFDRDQFGDCLDFDKVDKDGGVERIPAVPEDGGMYPADVHQAESFEMASTEGNQAPMINIEIHKLEVTIDYPDFNFDTAC